METYVRNVVAIVGLVIVASQLLPALEKKNSIDPTAAEINRLADRMDTANRLATEALDRSDRRIAAETASTSPVQDTPEMVKLIEEMRQKRLAAESQGKTFTPEVESCSECNERWYSQSVR